MLRGTTRAAAIGLAMLTGCLGRGQVDLLQARLRAQQQELVAAQSELRSSNEQLALAKKEAERLEEQLAASGKSGLLPEQTDTLVRVTGIKINPMLTAGLDKDEVAGDDTLVVQFSPVDNDGELVKLGGKIEIVAIDPSQSEAGRPLGRWSFDPEETRTHWTRGFLGSGYQFTLPWPEPPQTKEVVVHVRLTAPDGRQFEANQLVTITPPVVTAAGQRTTNRPNTEAVDPATLAPRKRSPLQESTNWMEHTTPVYR